MQNQQTRIDGFSIGYVRFWFWLFNLWQYLTFDHNLYFVQKCPKSAKSNPVFHLKGRHVRALALTYLATLLTEFFPSIFFLPLWPSLGGTWRQGSKLDQKCKFWVHLVSAKIEMFTNILYLVKISVKSAHICGCKSPTLSPKWTILWMVNEYTKFWKLGNYKHLTSETCRDCVSS